MDPAAYYVDLGGGRYRSTGHSAGAWSIDQQHMAPASALLIDAIEKCSGRDDLITSRVAFDILGLIHAGEVEVVAQVIRPGRTIELVESEMIIEDRPAIRATAWRLAVSDTSTIAGTELAILPDRSGGRPWDGTTMWLGGYIGSLDIRVLPGRRPGRGQVWMTTATDLVDGRPTSDLAHLFTLIDAANGIAVRENPLDVMFPNTDLTVHLFRRPVGRWLGLDTTVTFGSDGIGLTDSLLHDEFGPIGRAAQTLTVRAVH